MLTKNDFNSLENNIIPSTNTFVISTYIDACLLLHVGRREMRINATPFNSEVLNKVLLDYKLNGWVVDLIEEKCEKVLVFR